MSGCRPGWDKYRCGVESPANRRAFLSLALKVSLGRGLFSEDDQEYEVWTKCGHEVTNLNTFDWCKRLEELGVGELIVTSINNDGLGRGFDIGLLRKVCLQVDIPVVASGAEKLIFC